MPTNSDFASRNCACAASAAARWSAGRSRGSWMPRNEAIASISCRQPCAWAATRSEEHTSELQSLMRISYAVFCLKKKKTKQHTNEQQQLKTTDNNNPQVR